MAMSKADDLHNAIMKVIMESMKENECTYADVFGALSVSRSFFEVEYAARMAATWREAMKEDAPNEVIQGPRSGPAGMMGCATAKKAKVVQYAAGLANTCSR